MSQVTELGTHLNCPWISSVSYYISTAHATEDDKWVYLADIFPRVRVIADFVPSTDTYPNESSQSRHIWVNSLKAHNPDVYILYGAVDNPYFKPRYWEETKAYVLAEALWAENNEVDCFCIGNENLISSAHGTTHGQQATLERVDNVVTATFAFSHGFTTGDYIFVYGATPTDFNVTDSEETETVQCTVVSDTIITYPSVGSNGSATGTIYVDWSALEVCRKVLELAVLVQAVYTRGPVEYTESQGHIDAFYVEGITPGTDLDLIGLNAYGSGNNESAFAAWKSEVDAAFAEFGENLIITEHNVVQEAPDSRQVFNHTQNSLAFARYAEDEIVRRFNYAKDLGITQIYLFGPWGNGINWWMGYNVVCNLSPYGWHDETKRFILGNIMPVVDKLKNERPTRVFFGTCENT